MRKVLSLILCPLLVFGLFAGCSDKEAAETTEAIQAETTAAPDVPGKDFYTGWIPDESAATETAGESELNTVVLRDRDIALRKDYILLAVGSDAPFLAKGVTLNERGADALSQWIMTADTQAVISEFGVEEFGEAVFSLPTDTAQYTGKINQSTSSTKTIRLAVESSFLESGLLDDLLPAFEEAYRYTVSVSEGSAAAVLSTARSGYADLVLLEAGDSAQSLITDGFVRTVPGFPYEQLRICTVQYLLCGPQDDPAGVSGCASVTESFAAIANGGYTFTSRGDQSAAHRLEQQFWPAGQVFGDWYISADMEMGPCLVMNGIEGGYILTDKLTWLIYSSANGII